MDTNTLFVVILAALLFIAVRLLLRRGIRLPVVVAVITAAVVAVGVPLYILYRLWLGEPTNWP